MDVRLLGEVQLWSGDGAVDAGPPQQRAVLAALAADAGRVVGLPTLVDRLWDEAPPAEARSVIYSYVSRIRRSLAPLVGGSGPHGQVRGGPVRAGTGSPPRLSRRSGGYVLEIEPDRVDLLRFRSLVGAAGEVGCADGDRAALLRQALSLWRGTPLAELSSRWADRMRACWQRERVDATVQWAEIELSAGRAEDVIGEVRELVVQYPTTEPLVAVLMRALAALGRGAEGLTHYAALRAALADELGVEPGSALRAVHQAVLRGELDQPQDRRGRRVTVAGRPRGAQRPAGPDGYAEDRREAPSWQVPRQLPADIPDFTGRTEVQAALEGLFDSGRDEAAAVAVCVLSGQAGIGKTALAVRVAHRLAKLFPGGHLYVDLRGAEGEPLDPADVLGEFLAALGVDLARVPRSREERSRIYRSLLAGRRMIVVLDNAGGEGQVRPLLPGTADCAAIVTSRARLAGLEGARPVPLDVFRPEQARHLLGKLAGPQRVLAEPQAASAICQYCGYLPLAVRVAGARLAAKPHWTLSRYAERLADERRRLGELVAGDLEVRLSVGLSYRGLRAREALALRLLGLVAAPDFAAWVLAALLDCDIEEAEDLVERLVDAQLLEVAGPDPAGHLRYRFHDLLLAFAREQLHDTESEAARSAAVARLLEVALALAAHADALIGPGRRGRGPLRPVSGRAPRLPEVIENVERNPYAWLAAERAVLVSMVVQAHRTQAWDAAYNLAGVLAAFLEQRLLLDDWRRSHEVAVAAARRAGNPLEEAWSLRNLGDTSTGGLRRSDPQAQAHLEQALDLFRRLGDRIGEAHALRDLGDHYGDIFQLEAAEAALTDSLTLFGELGDAYGTALTLLAIGQTVVRWRPEDAIGYLHDCLPKLRECGDRLAAADAVFALGNAYFGRARLAEAAEHFAQARSMFQELPHPNGEGYATLMLGRTLLLQERCDEAVGLAGRALSAGRQLADAHLEASAAHCVGDCRLRQGLFHDAEQMYRRCLHLLEDVNDRHGDAYAYRGLGNAARGAGRLDRAGPLLERALATFRDLGIPRGIAETLQDLGDLHTELGHPDRAARCYRQALALFEKLGHHLGQDAVRHRLAALPDSITKDGTRQ